MEATLVCPTGQHLELPCMRRVAIGFTTCI